MKRLERLILAGLGHPRYMLSVVLALTVVFAWFFAHQQHNNHISIFFEPGDPHYVAYENFKHIFGSEEFTVVALKADEIFTAKNMDIIRDLTAKLERIPGVERVVSITNVEQFFGTDEAVLLRRVVPEGRLTPADLKAAKKRALANKFVTDHLIAGDGTMTALHVELESMKERQKRETAQAILRVARYTAGSDFTVFCSGPPFVEVELNRLSVKDFLTFIPVVIILLFIFLLVFLRQVTLAALCLINLLVVLVWGLGFFVMCGEKLNIITNAMGAVLMAIAIADSVHILSHLKNLYRHKQTDIPSTVRQTIKQVWFPCLFTSLTTGAGFLSFYSSDIPPVTMLGLFTAAGVFMAFFLSVTFLPILLIILRQWVARSMEKFKKRRREKKRSDPLARILALSGRASVKGKIPLLVFFALAVGISIVGIVKIRFETNTFNYLPDGNRIKSDFKVIERHFGGTIPFVLWIKSTGGPDFTHPEAVRKLEMIEKKLLGEHSDLTHVLSITEYLREFNQAIHANDRKFYTIPKSRLDIMDAYELGDPEVTDRLISLDRRQVNLTFLSKWRSNEAGYRLHKEATQYLNKLLGDRYEFSITGLSSLYLTMDRHLQESQIKSFFIAFFLIFLMMLGVCGNFWLAVISMVPNLFPIVLTLGAMGWFSIPLDVATTMIASVTMGIAVDDTIHFISWLRRNNAREPDLGAAVIRTFADVGKPIVITTLLLVIGFMVLALGSILPTRMFGQLTALSMALAMVGDFFVLPPLIILLKPKLPPLPVEDDRPDFSLSNPKNKFFMRNPG